MRIGHITLGTLALFGLLLMPFSTVIAQTNEQTAAVAAADVYAPGAPHGTWQSVIEPVTFYLAGTAPEAPSTDAFASTSLTYAPPASDDSLTARILGETSFGMIADQTTVEGAILYGIDVAVEADCVSSVTTLNPSVTLTISGIDFEPSTTGTQDASATVAAPGSTYEANFDFGEGLDFPAGTELTLSVTPSESTLSCEITVNDAASTMTIHADTAAINIWTAASGTESTPGTPIRSVPHASDVLPGQRDFEVHVAYTSLWPCLNGDDGDETTTACGGPDPGSDLIDDALTIGDDGLRVRNVDTGALQSSGTNIGTPDVVQVGDSAQARVYRVTYTNSFETGSTPGEGDFRFELITGSGGVAQSNVLSVGGKGIDFSVVGDAIREVNVGEPTTYRLRVENIGTERDVVTVSVNGDDASWDIDVLNGQVTVEPDAVADVVVRVTPPETGIPGDMLEMTASAASSFPAEVSIEPLELSVDLVQTVTTGATLTGGPGSLELFAGDELDLSGFSIENTGTKVGTYVIETRFQPAAQGWRAEATPPSRTVDAASVEDFSLGLTVSPNAAPGESHTLIVEARLLGGGVPPGARVEIPITIIFEAGLELGVRENERILRDDASVQNNPDTDYDRSAVFRVTLTNPTAVTQAFDLSNVWANPPAAGADDFCGDASPPTHNGWRMALWDAAEQGFGPLVDELPAATEIVVPGGERLDTFIALHWTSDDDLPDGCSRASEQDVTLNFQSQEDTDFETSISLTGSIVSGGENQGSHAPTLQAARYADGSVQKTQVGAIRSGGSYDPAVFQFVVVNDGNEHDDYSIQLPLPPNDGWTHRLAYIGPDAGTVAHPTNGNDAPDCSLSSNGRVLTCDDIGVGDRLLIEMTVTPPDNAPLGQTMTSSVIVTSGDEPGNKAERNFRTRTVGVNDFALVALRDPTDAARGQTAALPFSLQNVGTANDQFTLALTGGDDAWSPRFSGAIGSQQDISVPGTSDYNGFLLVETPPTATVGSDVTFTMQATSKTTGQTKTIDLSAEVVASNSLSIGGADGNNVLLERTGQANDIEVVFEAPASASCTSTTIAVDIDGLPSDWRVAVPTSQTVDLASSGSTKSASATFSVTPPADTLGTSTTAVRVTGTCGSDTVYADLVLSVDVAPGVDLALVSPQTQFVSPGAPTRWEMDVINTGLDSDTISLSTTSLPPGWSVDFEARQLAIGPIATVTTTFDVNVPEDAAPRSNVTFNVLATSQTDPSVIQRVAVSAVVGFRDITLSPNGSVFYGAPEETVAIPVPVSNDGTLSDRIVLTAEVQTPGYGGKVLADVVPDIVELLRGQTRDVLVTVELGRGVPADVPIRIALNATSEFATVPVEASADLDVQVLPFVRADVDGDLVDEYAVDRNRNDSDGFEEFRESGKPGGRSSVVPDLARFLNDPDSADLADDGRIFIDGDEDGKRDHFLDDTGDGLPDIYWDPDDEVDMRLDVAKDVDGDSVPDYFVDLDGDGVLDRVYNLVTGVWTDLIAIQGDNNRYSYIVDSNGNGEADADESVLVIASGRVARVTLMVDVDGDGRLDTVVDEDGDGDPDFFVRAGESRERRITLQDVNGDGVEDWTYDANLDGRNDAYYDPATQTGGHTIDETQSFLSLAAKYWFVPALFVLVLVLFIVLIAVTRR